MNSLRISSAGSKGRYGLIAALAGLTVLAAVGSLTFGAVPIPPGEVVDALLAKGFCFVTVEQLMEARGVTPEAGARYRKIPPPA